MSVGTGAKSFLMHALEQRLSGYQIGIPKLTKLANHGLKQFPIDPGAVFVRNDSVIIPNELTGTLGSPAGFPGRTAFQLDYSCSLRAAPLIYMLASLLGEPTETQDGADPAWRYVFPLTDDPTKTVSLCGLMHKAGSTTPTFFSRAKYNELSFDSNGTSEVGVKAKGMACADTECGIFIPDAGNTGTYAGAMSLAGNRADANKYTDTLTVQCSVAPTLGVVKFKTKLGAAALSTVEMTVTYDQATGKQTALTELSTDLGYLGSDVADLRDPLWLYIPGDIRTIALADKFVSPAVFLTPGDAVGETGTARTVLGGSRFGPAHVSVKRGASSADTLMDFESGSMKLGRQIAGAYTHGPGARCPYDLDVTGYCDVEFDLDRRFISREFERMLRLNSRMFWSATFEGPVITASTNKWRELVKFEFDQAEVRDVSSPLTGPGITKEKMKVAITQPSSGTFATVTVQSGTQVSFAGI